MRTENNPHGVDGYIRVSRIGGRAGEGYIAPDVQRIQIQEYAQILGLPILAWHDDQDYSGGNTQRPGFQTALQRIEAGETGGVIVAHTDRFSRSVADGSQTVRRILDADAIFASAMERMDPRTPAGLYMLNSFLNNAELALNNYKAGWRTAKTKAVERGAHIGRTPFGYDRVEGCLVPNRHAEAVGAVYQARLAGRSYSELGRLLDRLAGKPTAWTVTEVKRILRNRTYLGEVHYRGAEHDLSNITAHPPLIDYGTFEAVARTLTTGRQLKADSPFLLSGLIRCAHCRYSVGGSNHGGSNHDTQVYSCTRRSRCPGRPTITGRLIEEYVVKRWRALIGEMLITGQRVGTTTLSELDSRRGMLDGEIDAHVADLEFKRRLPGGWRNHLDVLLDERDRLHEEREEEFARVGIASTAAVDLDRLEPEALRAALRGAVQHIFVRRVEGRRLAPVEDRVRILWAGQPPVELPRAGRPGPFPPVDWDSIERPPRMGPSQVVEQGA